MRMLAGNHQEQWWCATRKQWEMYTKDTEYLVWPHTGKICT